MNAVPRLPITLVTILLSCLFSLLVILQHPILNDDAFGYLRAAERFQAGEFQAVLQDYGWYGYSLLMAAADPFLPGDLVVAAHVLNTLAYALLAAAFLHLCRLLGDSRRLQWFAALTILACPLINEMRYFVIRDGGFWAFAVLSLVYLQKLSRTGAWTAALGWALALLAATLFRLEGLLLLLAAPAGLLWPRAPHTEARRAQWQNVLRAVTCAAGLLLATLVLSVPLGLDLPGLAAYAYRHYLPAISALGPVIEANIAATNAGLFAEGNFPRNDDLAAVIGLVVMLFAYALALCVNLLKAAGLPAALVLAYAYRQHQPTLPDSGKGPLLAYFGILTAALLVFLLIMNFLTQRYITLPALLVLSLLPLALDALYARAQVTGTLRRFHILAGLAIVFLLADSLVSFGHSKQHLADAIAWTRETLPADATLHTNDMAIAHGSGRIADYDTVPRDLDTLLTTSAPGDYLVLALRRSDEPTLMQLNNATHLEALISFSNARGDEVRVLRQR